MKVTAVILGLVLSSTAPTAKTLDGAEFDAYTRGKTLVYQRLGVQYGAEQYLSNRRVVWSFLDGECKEGYWYPQGQEICFVYEDRPEPQCWSFKFGVDGLIASFAGDEPSADIYEADDLGTEMICLGPKVGV